MVRTETPVCNFNQPAIDFNLKGVDGNYYSLDNLNFYYTKVIYSHFKFGNNILKLMIVVHIILNILKS